MYGQSDIQHLKTMYMFMCILRWINCPVDIISKYIKYTMFLIFLFLARFLDLVQWDIIKKFSFKVLEFHHFVVTILPKVFFIIYSTYITYILLVIMLMWKYNALYNRKLKHDLTNKFTVLHKRIRHGVGNN